MIYKTRGIILKRTNLGEADRIVTIFTEDYGKIKVVAKGVRKTLSKMAGHLEPFCLTRLSIVEGRNLDTICGAEVEESFMGLREDLAKTQTAFYIAEIVDKMIEEQSPHPEIFELMVLVFTHTSDINESLLISYFEINFLAEMGFKPELYECTHCQEKLIAGANNFDFTRGGLVCESCGSGRPVFDATIKLIRYCLEHKFSQMKRIKIEKKVIKEIRELTNYYLKHIHQKDFKSEKYLIR